MGALRQVDDALAVLELDGEVRGLALGEDAEVMARALEVVEEAQLERAALRRAALRRALVRRRGEVLGVIIPPPASYLAHRRRIRELQAHDTKRRGG